MLAIVLCAATNSLFLISSMTVMQLEVPEALRGRVMGTHSITYSFSPLGALLLGAIAESASLQIALAFGASAFFAVVIAIAAARRPSDP